MKRLTILIAFRVVFFVVLVQSRWMAESFVEATICPVGSWCPANAVSGIQFLCPGGTYGDATKRDTPACSGPCKAGCVCKAGSTTDCPAPCPAGFFCVTGTGGEVKPVLCPEGFYCDVTPASGTAVSIGTVIPKPCPSGKYCPSGSTGPGA